MKSFKTLVCATSFALCFGAVSMANAATIAPAGASFTTAGSISVRSPASLNIPVTCNIIFTGTVNSGGAGASITGATVSGSNPLCAVPVLSNLPWPLTVAGTGPDAFTGTVTGVKFKIVSDCNTAPVSIAVNWKNSTNSLSISTPQTVGSCSITALTAVPTPAFTVSP